MEPTKGKTVNRLTNKEIVSITEYLRENAETVSKATPAEAVKLCAPLVSNGKISIVQLRRLGEIVSVDVGRGLRPKAPSKAAALDARLSVLEERVAVLEQELARVSRYAHAHAVENPTEKERLLRKGNPYPF